MTAIGPSPSFIRLTRDPDLPAPNKVERTSKSPGDIEIFTYRRDQMLQSSRGESHGA